MSSADEHRQAAKGATAACAVLTVSDSRTPETDEGGRWIAEALEGAGHRVVARALVRDEPAEVEARLMEWLEAGEAEVILTTGGTGISRRDTTVEVVERLLDRRLEGFGELFRMLSHREIGAAAMLSRAVAGLAGRSAIFALPGSPAAVRLALGELILPELPHLLRELRR